jgi:hypothetical protein
MEHIHNIPTQIASFYVNFNYALPNIKGLIRNQETQVLSLYRMEAELKPFGIINYNPYALRDNVRFTHIYTRFAKELIEQKSLLYTGIEPEVVLSFLSSLEDIDKGLRFGIERAIVQWFSDPDYMKFQLSTTRESWLKLIGTVQGSSLSPFLADICLAEMQDVLPENVHILQYADDAIIYGGKELRTLIESGDLKTRFNNIGLVLNTKKSGWVRNLIWIKPLQFLGVKYISEGNKLVASTRKGATLPFTKRWLLHTEYDIIKLLKTSYNNLYLEYLQLNRIRKEYIRIHMFRESQIALIQVKFQETLLKLYNFIVEFRDRRLVLDLMVLFGLLFKQPID